MNTLRRGLLMVILIASVSMFACAQNGTVRWSSIDAGFGFQSVSGTRLTSVLGQAFPGPVRGGNSGILGGFLPGLVHPLGVTSVSGHGNGEIPLTTTLYQNYPNPFNPSTVIKYTVGGAGAQGPGVSKIRLVVYDLLGREVTVLVSEEKQPGSYTVRFDGSGLASGTYFYRLTAGSFAETRKFLILR